MIILGFDPATTTGWSVLDDGLLVDYGSICPSSKLSLPQKLSFYHNEATRLFNRYKPDYVAMEDVILAISGAKTLTYLARINGVFIHAAYSAVKDNIVLYDPSHWKSNSLNGIASTTPKWKTQLEVCRTFNISVTGDFETFDYLIAEKNIYIDNFKKQLVGEKKLLDKLKSSLKRKRNPFSGDEKVEIENKIKDETLLYENNKIKFKIEQKEIDKELSVIGNDIYSQTGVSSDIADSIGIALCLHKKLE